MPINVFGNSNSNNFDNKIVTSLFVQKPYLRSTYIESDTEEDINLKNQYRIKNLPDPISIREATSKNYVDNLFNDPSIIKNTSHIDRNHRNFTNAGFIQVNQQPQIDSHLTAKLNVDNAIDETSLVRNNQDNDFGNFKLTNINSITLNKQAENDNQVITKAYVDQFPQENERSRRDVGLDVYDEPGDLVKNNQDNDFNDIKLTNLDSATVNRIPTSDNELANKQYVDDELDKNTIVRFDQTLSNYLKVPVGDDVYNLTKFDRIRIIDIREMRYPDIGGHLLQKWNIKCNKRIIQSRINDFIEATKTNSPTSESAAESLPPIGSSFVYIGSSSNNHDSDVVFVNWERTDTIQISNIIFYYNRFSILKNEDKKSMGRFRIQLLPEDNTWSTQYTIAKNSQYNTSTERKLLNLDFTIEVYGIKLIYDQIDTPHADMCFSISTITHSVY